MKKMVSVILALVMVFSCISFTFADELNSAGENLSFSDVPQDHYAAEAIYGLAEQGIVSGLPNGTFLPGKKLSRGEFTKILAAVAEAPLKAPQNNTFGDVKPEHALYKYIETMSYCFISFSNRWGDKPLFKPDNYVKREDAAYALVKLYNLDKDDDGEDIDIDTGILDDMFKDSKAISKNMKRYVAIAVQNNLMTGSNGVFNPKGMLTKADTCVIIYNALNTFTVDSDSEILTIDPKYVDPLAVGDVVKLKAMVSGKNGKKDVSDKVIWDSLSPSVVSVSSNGKITAISKGDAKITAEYNGQKASLTVNVNTGAPSSIKIVPEKANIEFGESYQLRATIAYPDGTVIDGNNSSAKLIWKSSNNKVAVVDSKGRVTGISNGKAVISVYFNDFPAKAGMCAVTVGDEDLNDNDATEPQDTNSQFDISSIKATRDNDNIKLTMNLTSEKVRSYFIFDPPEGKVISKSGVNAIHKGKNQLSVSLPIEQIKNVQELTMNFIADGCDEFNFVYLKTSEFDSLISVEGRDNAVTKNITFKKDFSSAFGERVVDKTDYAFVDDQELIGNWQCVDFIKTPDVFNPASLNVNNLGLFFSVVSFESQGKTSIAGSNWTQGYVIDKNQQTASKYIIKEIDGTKYMFMEWKSGDYIYRHEQPSYYVFKKIN